MSESILKFFYRSLVVRKILRTNESVQTRMFLRINESTLKSVKPVKMGIYKLRWEQISNYSEMIYYRF